MWVVQDRLKNDTFQMTKEDVEKTLGKREKRKIDVVQAMEKTYSSNQVSHSKVTENEFMDLDRRKLTATAYSLRNLGKTVVAELTTLSLANYVA